MISIQRTSQQKCMEQAQPHSCECVPDPSPDPSPQARTRETHRNTLLLSIRHQVQVTRG